jgi:hypothetical protein
LTLCRQCDRHGREAKRGASGQQFQHTHLILE